MAFLQSFQDALRHTVPCYLELSCYARLKARYDDKTWEGQPHDKEVVQVRG
jgi:hypothetical protein